MNITATLIGQIVAFILLIWFINRFLWGPLSSMMENRQKRIADGLAAAEKGRHELEAAEKHAQEQMQEAKNKAAEILAQAEKRANEIVEEAKGTGRTESERIVTAAHAQIDQEITRAREELRGQVVSIAVAGAEKILKREIDPKAHNDLLKDLVAQV